MGTPEILPAMNSRLLIFAPLFVAVPALVAQSNAERAAPPPPLVQSLPRATSPLPQPGTQRIYGPSGDTLIAREAANGVLEGFRKAYMTDGAPRVVIYVNRALVEPAAKTAGNENSDTRDATTGAPPVPTLADQQTVREIERLFGRAFRHAGAQLAITRSQPRSCLIRRAAGSWAIRPRRSGKHCRVSRTSRSRC